MSLSQKILLLVFAITAGCSSGQTKLNHGVFSGFEEVNLDVISTLNNDFIHRFHPILGGEFTEKILSLVQAQNRSFYEVGDIDHFYQYSEPPEGCLQKDCYGDYLLNYLMNYKNDFFKSSERSSKLKSKLKILKSEKVKKIELYNILSKVISRVRIYINKSTDDKKPCIVLLDSNHWSASLRDQALKEVLMEHPSTYQVLSLNHRQDPVVFQLLGSRLTSYVIIDDNIFKDVVTKEQWQEILFPNKRNPSTTSYSTNYLFDAHLHLLAGGISKLVQTMDLNNIKNSIILPLAINHKYRNISKTNEDALKQSKIYSDRMFPFVILNPNDIHSDKIFTDYLNKGAKGLKLINGHNDFFRHDPSGVLDPPPLRKVFKICERKKIPVIWHINSHLFNRGFFRILKDYPSLKIIIPHFAGYLSYAPNSVAKLLDQHPNLYIDISLGSHPFYSRFPLEDLAMKSEQWRNVFINHSNRFLFGLDFVIDQDFSQAYATHMYKMYREILEKNKYDLVLFDPRGWNWPWETSQYHKNMNGLSLPKETLDRIYWKNARALFD